MAPIHLDSHDDLGAPGRVSITDGTKITDKGIYRIPAGERLILQTPGGGGIGDPVDRDRDAVARDLSDGLITEEAAKKTYQHDTNGRPNK